MSVNIVYTIGYEGIDLEQFINIIKKNHIDTIIDVRKNPVSRKKGFSKSILNKILFENGIKYKHIEELGTPKDLREKLYRTKDFIMFINEYEKMLQSNMSLLEELLNEIHQENCCLLCYEKNYSKCHRSILAWNIKKMDGNGLIIKHL
ncbi:DUF488 family protein [Thermosediminibacter oceani]|uniref:DUF488 domain-containing protein n=1 Tax=Thermosediminibacter oceani (strain ATCC BAA-1034 / DSM 16646 / JW/IW-1228P) TaxID=555079 RepID=D9S1B8_THEOJ|nr:DUF488 domain-containing protein [Thermosediminibacter oceani]ADL07195.1 protein of unknown function DUF1130 [Thermosediminibacter oceani DSM 16646]